MNYVTYIRTELGDVVRSWSACNKLHPLVVDNVASVSGRCMVNIQTRDGGRAWCCHDYGHDGDHFNGNVTPPVTWGRGCDSDWIEFDRCIDEALAACG